MAIKPHLPYYREGKGGKAKVGGPFMTTDETDWPPTESTKKNPTPHTANVSFWLLADILRVVEKSLLMTLSGHSVCAVKS